MGDLALGDLGGVGGDGECGSVVVVADEAFAVSFGDGGEFVVAGHAEAYTEPFGSYSSSSSGTVCTMKVAEVSPVAMGMSSLRAVKSSPGVAASCCG